MNLLELAEKCEKATGPDRQLNAAIADALGFMVKNAAHQTVFIHDGKPGATSPLRYTASLDAAMTLVPEGWRWVMREASPNERGFFARLETRDFESVTWGKGSDWITDIVAGQDVKCWAATPALALCAAALRAHATNTGGHNA